jgi:hypothetical protein
MESLLIFRHSSRHQRSHAPAPAGDWFCLLGRLYAFACHLRGLAGWNAYALRNGRIMGCGFEQAMLFLRKWHLRRFRCGWMVWYADFSKRAQNG